MSLEHDSKKLYTPPGLKTFGSVESLTFGEGWDGEDDQWWFFSWGEDPNLTS